MNSDARTATAARVAAMKISICAKCLETKCACEFYRKRFPEEWTIRDELGYAPQTELSEPKNGKS